MSGGMHAPGHEVMSVENLIQIQAKPGGRLLHELAGDVSLLIRCADLLQACLLRQVEDM